MYETLGGDMTHRAFRQRIVKTGDKNVLRHVTVIEILPNDIAFLLSIEQSKNYRKNIQVPNFVFSKKSRFSREVSCQATH